MCNLTSHPILMDLVIQQNRRMANARMANASFQIYQYEEQVRVNFILLGTPEYWST